MLKVFTYVAMLQVAFVIFLPFLRTNAAEEYEVPIIHDPNLKVELVIDGINFPSSFAFLGPDDILFLEKDEGKVRRILNGQLLETPLLDVIVATKAERGMLGIAIMKESMTKYVYLYYTEGKLADGEDVLGNSEPLRNGLFRYELVDGHLINPVQLLDLPATPGYFHQGGAIQFGPDNNLYVPTGDVDHKTQAQNFQDGGKPDGTSGILRLSKDGEADEGILGDEYPLNLYYAYGIRNSFGIDFDPVTGNLWDTENGPWFGDEINLVEPGFNSGWSKIQGIWEPEGEEKGDVVEEFDGLAEFDGKGEYSDPEFIWEYTVGPSAVKFYNSTHLGQKYLNDMFVGNVNEQALYHFELSDDRRELDLEGNEDKIVKEPTEFESYKLGERFGRISDIEIGPDNNLYILSHKWNEDPSKRFGTIYRIVPLNHTVTK